MCKDSQRDQIVLDSVTPNHATANHSDHEGSSTPSPAASDLVRQRIGKKMHIIAPKLVRPPRPLDC